MTRLKKLLKSEKGEATYISSVVYVFAVVVCIALILNVFSVLMTKTKLDSCADQMTKQIQLAGGTNADTQTLFAYIQSNIPSAENVRYSIDTRYKTPTPSGMRSAIQLGTPFYITVSADAQLGGFWKVLPVRFTITAKGAGVSEKYWK